LNANRLLKLTSLKKVGFFDLHLDEGAFQANNRFIKEDQLWPTIPSICHLSRPQFQQTFDHFIREKYRCFLLILNNLEGALIEM
jgi:hypothetical protein